MSTEYTDISAVSSPGEAGDRVIESTNAYPRKVQPVGEYVSDRRTITIKPIKDGNFSVKLLFVGGLRSVETGKVWAERFPLQDNLNTFTYHPRDREGNELPFETSSVAEYLKHVGFNTRGMTIADMLAALNESQNVPVKVFVSREDKPENIDGTWVSAGLKLRDFFTGIDAAGKKQYADEITKDGKTYKARPKISSYNHV